MVYRKDTQYSDARGWSDSVGEKSAVDYHPVSAAAESHTLIRIRLHRSIDVFGGRGGAVRPLWSALNFASGQFHRGQRNVRERTGGSHCSCAGVADAVGSAGAVAGCADAGRQCAGGAIFRKRAICNPEQFGTRMDVTYGRVAGRDGGCILEFCQGIARGCVRRGRRIRRATIFCSFAEGETSTYTF